MSEPDPAPADGEPLRLLVVSPRPDLVRQLVHVERAPDGALIDGPVLRAVGADGLEPALARWADAGVGAALVDLDHDDPEPWYRILCRLREADPDERRSLLALVPRPERQGRVALDAINAAADDFVCGDPLDTKELALRLALAQRRAARISGELSVRQYAAAAMDKVLDALPLVAVQFQTDDLGRYRMRFDPAHWTRLGLEIPVPAGLPARELARHVAPVDRARVVASCTRALRDRSPFSEAFALMDLRGKTIPVRVFAAPSATDAAGVQTWNGLVLDVSQQRELEHRVACATAGVRSKRAFLATASHELRTPLTAIIGMSQVLLRELPPDARGFTREALAVIESSGGQLLRLVEDVLELAHLGGGDVALEARDVDLSELVSAEIERALPRAAEAGVRIGVQVQLGARLEGDAPRLARALRCLVDNAIKFTPAGGAVEVTLAREPARGRLALEIADTGIGIAPDQARALLQPLTQLDSGYDRRFGGMGMGLALAARIVALSGGSLDLDADAPRGTRIVLALPIPEGDLAATLADVGHGPGRWTDAGPPVVAVVADASEPLVGALCAIGVAAHVVDGLDALAALAAVTPVALAIVGYPVGGLDATTLAQRLARDPATARVPIAIAASLLLPGDRARFRDAGASFVLPRPITASTLVRLVAHVRDRAATGDVRR